MAIGTQTSYYAAPDGGWGWLVVFASFTLQALTIGITYTFGIMYVELLSYFKESRSATAWIGSIQPCLLYFTGIIAAPLIKRFSWRPVAIAGSIISAIGFGTSALVQNMYLLYLTYGVLTGVGNGLMYVTSMVAVQHYFDSRRAMATGIAVSGSGVGTLVFGVLVQYLIDTVGWRWTMVAEAAIILLGIFCGALFRPLPTLQESDEEDNASLKYEEQTYQNGVDQSNPNKSQSDNVVVEEPQQCCGTTCCGRLGHDCKTLLTEIFDFSLFKKPLFILFCFSILMFTFGYHVPYTYTPDRAVSLGVDRNSASFLVSIMGIANVASRLIFGWISDRSPKIRFWMTGVVLTGGGVISMLIFLFNTHPLLIVYSVFFGAFSGCFASLFPVVLVDLLGIENIERSIGLSLSVSSFGFLVASPLSGWIIDITNSFNAPFYVVGSLEALGGVVFFFMACLKRIGDRKQQYEDIKEDAATGKRRKRYVSESFA